MAQGKIAEWAQLHILHNITTHSPNHKPCVGSSTVKCNKSSIAYREFSLSMVIQSSCTRNPSLSRSKSWKRASQNSLSSNSFLKHSSFRSEPSEPSESNTIRSRQVCKPECLCDSLAAFISNLKKYSNPELDGQVRYY